MASIIAPVDPSFKERIELFPWVNWSEAAREELNKRRIFEEFRRARQLSKEDEKFCEALDWHPVDELPMKKEFVERLKRISKEPSKGKSMTPEEFKKWCDSL